MNSDDGCWIPKVGAYLMLVHIFRGVGRVFAFTEDANGTNLPSQYGP